jgi:hypothetical protein
VIIPVAALLRALGIHHEVQDSSIQDSPTEIKHNHPHNPNVFEWVDLGNPEADWNMNRDEIQSSFESLLHWKAKRGKEWNRTLHSLSKSSFGNSTKISLWLDHVVLPKRSSPPGLDAKSYASFLESNNFSEEIIFAEKPPLNRRNQQTWEGFFFC